MSKKRTLQKKDSTDTAKIDEKSIINAKAQVDRLVTQLRQRFDSISGDIIKFLEDIAKDELTEKVPDGMLTEIGKKNEDFDKFEKDVISELLAKKELYKTDRKLCSITYATAATK